MDIKIPKITYAFVTLAGVCFISGIAILNK